MADRLILGGATLAALGLLGVNPALVLVFAGAALIAIGVMRVR